jgi:regulator of sirC expression with transglutaminase-like and TPR domain
MAGRAFSALALMNVNRSLDSAQWASAKADLKPILAIRPNFVAAIDDHGEAEVGLGHGAAALADYDRALKLAPNDLMTRALRGQLYQQLGKTGQAAADFAAVYHADQATPGAADVTAFVKRIDHSRAPSKAPKRPVRRHRPRVEAEPPPEQAPQTEPPAQT